MPGKHAPASPKSFLVSLATAAGGAIAALAVVVGIALLMLNAGGEEDQGGSNALPSRSPTTAPVSSPTPSDSPTASPSPAGEQLPASETTLRILNASGRPGIARSMAARAREQGYPEAKVGNLDRTPKSTIYYRTDGLEEARAFQEKFPEFTEIAAAPSSFSSDVVLTVVIGLDYPSPAPSPSASPSP